MLRLFALWIALGSVALGQTVLGVISGRVGDDVDGQPIPGAMVIATNRETGAVFSAEAQKDGSYSLILLPPGVYDLEVTAGTQYRPALVKELEVPVAGFIQHDIALRLLTDVWQRGVARSSVTRDLKSVLLFYGPDVDTSRWQLVESAPSVRGNLEPSISDVVTRGVIDRLPLAGRDVYELIALQPGAANNLATVRSTGVSVNGQRPSASSFLLDGRENNNYLITGPFASLPPEAVEQYRVSTNNFAAEYGRTSGYLANAVTRQGTADWHGLAYTYIGNDHLNASARQPSSSIEPGLQLTGPVIPDRLFTSSLIDFSRDHTLDESRPYNLPAWAFIDSLDKDRAAWHILNQFRPSTAGGAGQIQTIEAQRPFTNRRLTAVQRADWDPSSERRISASLYASAQSQPDFFWLPYSAFVSGLYQNAVAAGVTATQPIGRTIAEFRAAVTHDSLGWDQAHPDIPRLAAPKIDVVLPGSPARYILDNSGTALETSANFALGTNRHLFKWGGGFLARFLGGTISTPDGNLQYTFDNLDDFALDKPAFVRYGAIRHAAIQNTYAAPDMSRRYNYGQSFVFAQDSFRVSSRFLLHYGFRYDYFGSPSNVGRQKDSLIGLGPGNNLEEKLVSANFLPLPGGSQKLYGPDHNDAAARVGFAVNIRRNGDSILRGSYGLFYDRPFDNLWLNLRFNDAVPATTTLGIPNLDYLAQPLEAIIGSRPVKPVLENYPLTLYQPGFRTPYVHSFFFGIQQRLSEWLIVDVNYAGSLGRKLLTTDLVNRASSASGCNPNISSCRPGRNLNVDVDYRGNQGSSAYHGLVSSLRMRYRRGEARVSYTFSHAIDNQSDPLTGALSQNLQVTKPSDRPVNYRPAGFTVPYGSSFDRGNADFDQRHNLVFYSYVDLPAPVNGTWRKILGGWSLAQIGAIRSGSPFTIYSGSSRRPLHYNRADLIFPQSLKDNTGPFDGGKRLLNPNSFADPAEGKLGTSGRNAFAGPGFYNVDVSLSRTFHAQRLGENRLLLLRVDAYNFLNHANLSNPQGDNLFTNSENFAVARYGRTAAAGGLLGVTPLNESPRRLQIMFRLLF